MTLVDEMTVVTETAYFVILMNEGSLKVTEHHQRSAIRLGYRQAVDPSLDHGGQ
jgi:hypothetical protein